MPGQTVEPVDTGAALEHLEREARIVADRTDLPEWVRARAAAVAFEAHEIGAALESILARGAA